MRTSFSVLIGCLLILLPSAARARPALGVYDALGRRVSLEDPVAGTAVRYYYDGDRVIEERDAGDSRLRYHVNGAQFIDERVTTFDDAAGASGEFLYYLHNKNFNIAGTGNADGSVIDRLDFSSSGDFDVGGGPPTDYHHDADADLDIDLRDFINLQLCLGETASPCTEVHDFDASGSDDDIDSDDLDQFVVCMKGPLVTPDQACGVAGSQGGVPRSGSFAMHGRPVDVLSDGLTLYYIRARYYDPAHGRWLQRDPAGYVDGGNLYESFAANALGNVDPYGFAVDTSAVLRTLYADHPELKRRWELMAGAGWTFRFGNPGGWFTNQSLDWNTNSVVVSDTASAEHAAEYLAAGVNAFYGHDRGRMADYQFRAGEESDAEIIQTILSRGGGILTDEQKTVFAHEVATIDAATQVFATRLKAVGLTAVAVVWEPADWVITVRGWTQGQFSYWDLAALVPLIPATGGKALRLVSESGDDIATVTRGGIRIGSGRAYSVVFESKIPAAVYPGHSRLFHYREATRVLLAKLDADPAYAEVVESVIPGIREQLRGPRGGISRFPPEGWTWHHSQEPGVMQLIPRVQHEAAGDLQELLHPGGKGGYTIWGR